MSELSTQTRNHLISAILALPKRLQHDEHTPGVGCPAATDKSGYGRNRRILHDDGDIVVHLLANGLKGDVLLRLNGPAEPASVLLREEPLGNENVEIDAQTSGGNRNHQNEELVPQNPAQRTTIGLQKAIERAFTPAIQTAVLFTVNGTQQLGAHHGRCGQ